MPRTISRDIVAGLIRDSASPDAVLAFYGRAWTHEEMAVEVENGTDLGREYASDILKVSRDILRSRARKAGR